MSKLKPVKCRCGRRPKVEPVRPFLTDASGYFVICPRLNGARYSCWTGPIRKTEAAAIRAWNAVMGGDDEPE